ncbi:hypothetical protein EYW98_21900 [Escherichia coli]|nr:hypothetical protein [Escherichia coli]EGO8379462.1 hypothetical protein [Escherichia coli]
MVLMIMIVAGVYILAPVNTGYADTMKGLLWSLAAGFSNALIIFYRSGLGNSVFLVAVRGR